MLGDGAAGVEGAASAIEVRIMREAQRFDLGPLLDVLAELGYSRDEILFEGALYGRSPSIVQAVRFRQRPVRTAIVTVHLGLLGDNTLLPSYFYHVAERSPDPARFYDFLRFFDHQLIENFVRAIYPEVGETHPDAAPGEPGAAAPPTGGVFGDFRAVLKTFFRMAGPGSLSTLHWVTQLYFPEFRVRVRRSRFENATDSHACRTGDSRLDGSGILGRSYVAESPGFVVDLIAEDEVDLSGREQADIVRERLETRFLPLLAPFSLALTVRLIVLWHSSFAYVDDPHAEDKSFLGYNRLRGPREVRHTTVLYRGITGRPSTPSIRRGAVFA
nr:MAG: hypothetical protein DIU78_21545 [Pseudomonadota bacterium]